MKVWMDGQLVDKAEAKLSVFDHCTLYGDGVFEGIRVYGGQIFKCTAHIDRLYESAAKICLDVPYGKQQLVEAMKQTVAANAIRDGYIRLVITRGAGTLGLNPRLCPQPSVFIIADTIALYPREMYNNGMAVIIAQTHRIPSRCLDLSIKSCNYLNNILAKIEALDAGLIEAIMLNEQGNVAECTGDNIFIVCDGMVVTPPLEDNILNGITRQIVLDLATEMGLETRQESFTPDRLFKADECFLTGTAAEVIAVTRVDDQTIGDGKPGAITQKLLDAFRAYIAAGDFE
ncbi:MAG: branched-chain-amino-acid transaminase [Phycisphaerae bacterium]